MNEPKPILLPGIHTDDQLGHYLVAKGWKSFPKGMTPFLDYSAIGADHRETFDGAFTTDGYRCSRLAAPDPKAPFVVYVTADGLSHEKNFFIQMPLPDKQLTAIADQHGFYVDQLTPYRVECRVPGIQELLPEEIPTPCEVNEFAFAVSDCERFDGGLDLLRAACIAERQETWDGLIEVARNLDFYELIPDNLKKYARKVLVSDYRNQRCLPLLNELDEYIDYDAYAQVLIKQRGVRYTKYGLVRKKYGAFPPELPGGITWKH